MDLVGLFSVYGFVKIREIRVKNNPVRFPLST
jgi:hypothetical protein